MSLALKRVLALLVILAVAQAGLASCLCRKAGLLYAADTPTNASQAKEAIQAPKDMGLAPATSFADTGSTLPDPNGVAAKMDYWKKLGYGGGVEGTKLLDQTLDINGKKVRILVTQVGGGGGSEPPPEKPIPTGLVTLLKDALAKDAPPDPGKATVQLSELYVHLKVFLTNRPNPTVNDTLGIRDQLLTTLQFKEATKLKETAKVIDAFLKDQLNDIDPKANLSKEGATKVAATFQTIADALKGLP